MTAQPPRIVVVGSAVVDLTTFTDAFPQAGETIVGRHFDLGWGGKGANQAVAAHLCGAHVDMVARVGDDLFGPATIENFVKQGIGAEHVRVVRGASSGVAPVLVDSSGQNRIIVVKGANDRLTPADVDEALPLLKRADWVVLQLEVPIETVFHTVAIAKRLNLRCIVNPAPAQPLDVAQIASVDYLIPNEPEAEALTGLPVRTLEEARACGTQLLSHGLSRVIITLGERGAMFCTADGATHVPGVPVATKDTTGAGDAFIGSFVAFLAEGRSEREAIARANLYAALSTTAVGTQKSFVTRQRFDSDWEARARVEA